jgi:hypothetical protein
MSPVKVFRLMALDPTTKGTTAHSTWNEAADISYWPLFYTKRSLTRSAEKLTEYEKRSHPCKGLYGTNVGND